MPSRPSTLATTIVPPKPKWYFSGIIAVGVIAAINLISTVVSFCVMWRRSRAGTGVGLWFFKTQYGHSSGLPYIMPNALTMFLFWNLIFMLLMQPYIWLNYLAYCSPNLGILSRMYFWYGFVFIWDSVGMWTSAFGTLYATLLPKLFTITSSSRNIFKNALLHPITLNTLCFSPPLGLAITQIVTSTYSSSAWSNIVHTQFKLVKDLSTLAAQWSLGGEGGLQQSLHHEAIELGNLFLEQKEISRTAFQRNAATCAGWYILCILLFTPTAIWLLHVIRHTTKMRARRVAPLAHLPVGSTTDSRLTAPTTTSHGPSSPKTGGFPTFSPKRASFRSGIFKPPLVTTGSADGGTGSAQQDASLKDLRRAFYTVSLQSVATLVCMIATAGSWLWVCLDASRVIVTPTLHAFAIMFNMWVFAIVGCLVNLFILIRTYRTVNKGTHSSTGNMVAPMSPMRPTYASPTNSGLPADMSRDQKPVLVHASTVTHIVIDSPPLRLANSVNGHSDTKLALPGDGDLENGSSYSLSTMDPPSQKENTVGEALAEV
ncbi:hypothetical protein FRC07_011966 [Ceratobasidium sp. 392]|nr:hypothetical protein FRC07_011966 [Ceratobasidium sp. 392]